MINVKIRITVFSEKEKTAKDFRDNDELLFTLKFILFTYFVSYFKATFRYYIFLKIVNFY